MTEDISDTPEVGFDDGDDPASTQGDITFRYHDKVEREQKRRVRSGVTRRRQRASEEGPEGEEQSMGLHMKSLIKEHVEVLHKQNALAQFTVHLPPKPLSKKEQEERERVVCDKLAEAARRRVDLLNEKKGFVRKTGLKVSNANAQCLSGHAQFVYMPKHAATSLGQRMKAASLTLVTPDDSFLMKLMALLDGHIECKMKNNAAVPYSNLCQEILDPDGGCRRDLIETAANEFGVDIRCSQKQVLSSKQVVDAIYKKRFVLLSSLAQEVDQAHRGYARRKGMSLADANMLPTRAASSLGQGFKAGFARLTAEDRYVMAAERCQGLWRSFGVQGWQIA